MNTKTRDTAALRSVVIACLLLVLVTTTAPVPAFGTVSPELSLPNLTTTSRALGTCYRILFDETHGTSFAYTVGADYDELAALLADGGHSVDVLQDPAPFDYATLSQYDVLALVLPKEAYTAGEKAAIQQFVTNGGRLVTISDHGGSLGSQHEILNEIHTYLGDGLQHNADVVYDPTNNQGGKASWPLIHTFSADPVNQGLGTIVQYSAASLQVTAPGLGTAFGDDDTYTQAPTRATGAGEMDPDLAPEPVRWDGIAPAGQPAADPVVVQAMASVGAGDVFALGDAGLFSSKDTDGNGTSNLMEYHNSQLARNVFARGELCQTPVQKCYRILFDESHGTSFGYTLAGRYDELATFLEDKGQVVEALQDRAAFNAATLGQYDVLALVMPTDTYSDTEKAAIDQFVNDGGRLVTISDHGGSLTENPDGLDQAEILNDIHTYLGDGLTHNADAIYDPTDNQYDTINDQPRPDWPFIHRFSSDAVNTDLEQVVEFSAASLQVITPALGTAFGDEDTYTQISARDVRGGPAAPDIALPAQRQILQPAGDLARGVGRAPLELGISSAIHAPYSALALLREDFEGGVVPPDGWTEVVSNTSQNWQLGSTGAYSGTYKARVLPDPGLVPQDEWLLSPEVEVQTGALSFWSAGSLDRCRDALDNCDLNVWLVVGPDAGDGDDMLLATADGDWAGNYVWSQSLITFTLTPPTTTVRVGFQYTGTDGAEVNLDAILLEGESVIAQAMATIGDGDVFAIGDAGIFAANDPDGNGVANLLESDNAQLAHNVFARGQECDRSCPVALFKDQEPLAAVDDPNELALRIWGLYYDVLTASQIGTVDLEQYCKIIVASGQTNSFYQTLSSNRAWFEGWIRSGGIFELHGATDGGEDWSGLAMPGGFSMAWDPSDDVTIRDPVHPIVTTPYYIGDAELDGWGTSTHGYLVDLPAVSGHIVVHEPARQLTVAELLMQDGCILATTQPLEMAWDQGESRILENMILDRECQPLRRYLPVIYRDWE